MPTTHQLRRSDEEVLDAKVDILCNLAEVAGVDMSQAMLESFFRILDAEGVTLDELRQASDVWLRMESTCPHINEFLEYIEAVRNPPTPVRVVGPYDDDEWRSRCERVDREELGMNLAEYQRYRDEYQRQTGEEYIAPGVEGRLR